MTRPDVVRLADWFTPLGLHLADLARTECISDIVVAMAGLTNGDLLRDPAAAVVQAKEVLADQEIPVVGCLRTVELAACSADAACSAGAACSARAAPAARVTAPANAACGV